MLYARTRTCANTQARKHAHLDNHRHFKGLIEVGKGAQDVGQVGVIEHVARAIRRIEACGHTIGKPLELALAVHGNGMRSLKPLSCECGEMCVCGRENADLK